MQTNIKTRFAPSPTGYMHIGNLRTALYSYLLAKSQGGKFVLRIEDTDRSRLVEGAVEVILETLKTAGIEYDEGPYVQSERLEIYREYAEKLIESGHAYRCFCTQERLDSLKDEKGIGGYDGFCRSLTPEQVRENLEKKLPYVIRQKMPDKGVTKYTDMIYGEVAIDNSELNDQILIKADGYPTYNFCHVIDDYLMGITHVIRGNEYLVSTPKYCLLYDAFGWERPVYVHLPLLMGKDGDGNTSKLSKRHGAVSFQDLLAEGYLPEAVVNYIALLGWCPKDTNQEFFTIKELEKLFSMDGISKSPAVFDYEKLRWFNSEYIKKMSDEEFDNRTIPVLEKLLSSDMNLKRLSGLLHTRISAFSDIEDSVKFITELQPMDMSFYTNKKNKTTPEICRDILADCLPILEQAEKWDNDSLFAVLKEYCANSGRKAGAVMWAVRVAVARQTVTPGGATELMDIFGRERSIERIKLALSEFSEN